MGVVIDDLQCTQLLTHLWLVLSANEQVNLTAITSPEEAITKHVVDSLLFLKPYREGAGRYLDMGTGAGYPGIVLEIMEPRPGVLLDSRNKKIDACRRFCDELGLVDVACCAERIEDHAREHREDYGTITARALAPLGVILEYAQPLLTPGGYVIASKGSLSGEELKHGSEVAELLGFEGVSCETFQLPRGAGKREILVYRKVGDSSVRLPRKAGMATKRPL